MHQMKLAQLCHFHSFTKDQKCKFLEHLDGNETSEDEDFLGYSPLHFAVTHNDFDLVSELIRRGADVLKQESRHKKTPLHLIAIRKIDLNEKRYSHRRIENELSNALLSAQIETNNATNPVCDTGVSHFHIACFFNHKEAIHFFINAGVPVNQASDIGCTPLHFAVKSSSVEAIKILLTHGADVNLKDAKGISPLDLLVQNLDEDDVEWIDTVFNFVLELKMDDLIFFDNSEITSIHMACMLKNNSIALDFITKGYNFNRCVPESSKIWSGWTPLHFAACYNLEIFELLIQNGVNLDVKLQTGATPLDLCGMKYAPATVGKLLSTVNKFKDISLSNSSIKLSDVLEAMDGHEKFIYFLDNLTDINVSVPFDSIIWPGNSILHFSVLMNQEAKEIVENSNSDIFLGFVGYDSCKQKKLASYMKRLETCLEKGCNVSLKNADGLTPIHLAFRMHEIRVVKKLLSYCQDDATDRDNLSLLHIACVVGDVNAVKRLVSKGASINSQVGKSFEFLQKRYANGCVWKDERSVEAQSTPLHVAVIFKQSEVAEFLVDNGADFLAKDARGLTPIHRSRYSTRYLAAYLLGHALKDRPVSEEVIFPQHFSYLFVAAFADDERAIEQLLQHGASVDVFLAERRLRANEQFDSKPSGLTPLHIAVNADSDKAVCALIKGGANIFVENPHSDCDSPLQRAFDKANEPLFKYFVENLKRNGTTLGSLDASGLTQLHLACASFDLEWATELLQRGANVNATKFISNDLKSKVMTPLSLLVLKSSILLAAPPNFMNLLHLLLQKGADVTIGHKENVLPLLCAYNRWFRHKDDIPPDEDDYFDSDDEIEYETLPFLEIADLLLESQASHNLNPADRDGFSHFHYACLRNNVEVVKKFLDNGIDVNQMTCPYLAKNAGFTPLHFAIANRAEQVVSLLIETGADVNAKNTKGETPLHVAIINGFVNFQLFEELLRHGANINAQNMAEETPMICLLKVKGLTLEKLQFFINRGAVIDAVKHGESISKIVNTAIENSISDDVVPIYKALLNICKIECVRENSYNAIHSIAAVYDENRTLDFYLDTIKQFLQLGCDINWQDRNGKTALCKASMKYVNRAVEALLILGADVSIVDQEGMSCLTQDMVNSIDYHQDLAEFDAYTHPWDTMKILVHHAKKMKLAKLDIVESFAEAVQSAENTWNFDASFEQTLQNELTMVENKVINQELPVRRFLSEFEAVVEYPMMHFVLREAIDEFFSDFDGLRKEFPQFCGLLMMQYRRALKRIDLIRSAKYVITTECGIELPDLCLEAIFRYFKNDDLKILTSDYTDETFHPCKRQKVE